MTLSNPKFAYSDSLIAAELRVDVVGDYIKRGPTAVIVPVNVPRSCADPVTFRAASSDLDNQNLTHFWWVPGILVASATTLDLVLTNGTHSVALISKDPDGKLDATAIRYTRTCV